MKDYYKRISSKEELPSSFVTGLLCLILVVVYIFVMFFFPYQLLEQSPDAIYLMGMSAEILKGEYYRIFSSIWLHGNVVHLASNLLFLFIFSFRLEELSKGRTVVIVFILSGIVGNIGSILWIVFSIPVISVGSSGAIFGLFGAVIYLLKGKSKRDSRAMVFILVIFFSVTISQDTNVLSHFFGMVSGPFIIKVLKSISKHTGFQFF